MKNDLAHWLRHGRRIVGGCAMVLWAAFAQPPAAAAPGAPVLVSGDVQDVRSLGMAGTYLLEFRWADCQTSCDFYQVRWAKEGDPEVQEHQAKGTPLWRIGGTELGVTYVFKVQACDSGMFGSSCSGWSERRVIVPGPPTTLKVSDVSAWEGRIFARKVRLTWRAGVRLAGIRLEGPFPGMVVPLAATATNFDYTGPLVDRAKPEERWDFKVCGYIFMPNGREVHTLGCSYDSVQIPVPPSFGQLPACQPPTVRPADGAPGADWLGIWGDTGLDTERDRIVARVTNGGSAGRYHVSTGERAGPHISLQRHITADASDVALTSSLMPAYVTDRYWVPTIATAHSNASGAPAPGPASAHPGSAPAGLRPATTLALPNHVTLELYLGCLPAKQSRGYYVRYLRTSNDGQVLTDVMLTRSQDAPR